MLHRDPDRQRASSLRAVAFLQTLLAACFVLACSKGRDPAGAPAPAPTPQVAAQPPQPGPQLDLSDVMKRVRLRFRPDGGGWVGGQPAYTARVGAEGMRFAPRVSAKNGHPVQTGAELVLGPAAVARGGAGGAARQAPIVDQQKGLAIDRGLATEELENTEEGLEQSFRFDARPAGGGDVTVRMAVSGQRYNGATANGLHFVDDASRMGVRYGAATWVDAAGVRTPVAAKYDAGTVVLTVPAALVERSAYPAVLDPVIGPEIGTDAPIYTNSGGAQYVAGASYGGGQHLVVWFDSAPQPAAGGWVLWAARVSAAGAVLDPYGIWLGVNVAGSENQASIAFDGTNWLVAWEQCLTTTCQGVYGTLVSASGVAASPGGVQIASSAPNSLNSVALSYGGGSYLVAYADSSYTVHGQMVATSGMPAGSPFTISTVFTSGANYPEVVAAYNGTSHLVAYAETASNGAIYAREVTTSGTLASGDILTSVSGFYNHLSVASNGIDWMVAFQTSSSTFPVKIARVTAAGNGLDQASGGVTVNSNQTASYSVSIVWNGSSYAVFCDRNNGVGTNDLQAVLVSTSASVGALYTGLVSEVGAHFGPIASFDTVNSLYLVAFDDNRLATTDNPQDVRFNRFNTSFVKQESPSVLVTRGANDQQRPAAAWNGTDWLVVWEDSRGSVPNIWGTRIDPTGTVLDTNGIQIGAQSNQEQSPRVTTDGSNWLVVWVQSSNSGIYAARVNPVGTVLDTAPITVGTLGAAGSAISVAEGASTYAIAYNSGSNVVLERLSTAGGALGNTTIGAGTTGAVAFNGTSFLVEYAGSGTPVYAKRVTPAGTILDATALTVSFSTTVSNLAVTAMGGQWLAGWVESTDVHAARISAAGTVLDVGGFVVASAAGTQSLTDANNDGTNYWLLWQDNRANANGYDVYGGRVSPTGAVLDGSGFPIVTASSSPGVQSPALSGGPSGQVLVTYARDVVSPSQDASRVYSRIINAGSGANGTACTTGGQCTSGFCVSGVCCNTACNGACQACTAALKGSGADGTCGNAAAGTNPGNLCVASAQSSCGQTGSCNASGACALWPSGTSCGAGTCAGTVATPQVCNGAGTCGSGVGVDCSPYVCAAGACKNPCATSADCISGDVCNAGVCSAPLGNGAACSTGSQCQSGFCVEGVCCNIACNGVCQACTAALKGSGADGTCGNAAAGTNPGNSCTMTAQSTCGQSGTCNGAGACALWPSGTTCGSPTCQGTVVKAQDCNGAGACTLQTGGTDCTPYACAGGACKTSCATSSDCASGYTCSGGVCGTSAGNGSPCATSSQCTSGFCVDGVCCNTACTGVCQACTAALKGGGADGTCGNAAAGTNPGNACVMQAASTCGQTGTCNGAGACQLYPVGTTCGSAACIGTVAKQHTCDGMGTCGLQTGGTDCTPYACSGGVCGTSCKTSADCAGGFVCSNGACVVPLGNGLPCTTGAQCQSTYCVDGVCCNTACGGLCQACSVSKKGQGASGTCGPILAGTDPDDECAPSAQSTCGQNGQCDGSGACQLWPQGTSCGASTCQGNVVAGHTCNGTGTCTVPAGGQDCTPYVCNAGACANPCATSADCVSGYFCNAGVCKQLGATGSPCTTGTQCASTFCVDGVCCDTACTAAPCQACSAAVKGQGTNGTCGPVVAGTTCAPATCTGATSTPASQCDGNGTCAPGTSKPCSAGYVCAGSACASSCVDDTACASGYHCTGGMCELPDAGSDAGNDAGSGAGTGGSASGTGGATSTTSSSSSGSGTGGSASGTGGATSITSSSSSGSGTGGAGTGGSGAGGAGTGGTTPPPKSGCGCRTAGDDGAPDLGAAAALAGLALIATRRRRGRPADATLRHH